jgi:hypothetical protein
MLSIKLGMESTDITTRARSEKMPEKMTAKKLLGNFKKFLQNIRRCTII